MSTPRGIERRVALSFFKAMQRLVVDHGYDEKLVTLWNAEKCASLGHHGKAAVQVEIAHIEFIGGYEVCWEGHYIDLRNYGFVRDRAVLCEPYYSFMMEFYPA